MWQNSVRWRTEGCHLYCGQGSRRAKDPEYSLNDCEARGFPMTSETITSAYRAVELDCAMPLLVGRIKMRASESREKHEDE